MAVSSPRSTSFKPLAVPIDWSDEKEHRRKIAEGLNALVAVENATYFDDYIISGLGVRLRGTADPTLAEFRGGLYLYQFSGTASQVNEAYFTIHILHGIRPNSTPTFHVHWSQNVASPSGNVKWQIDYSIARGYGLSTYAAPTSLSTISTCATQYQHIITDDDDMPLASNTELEPDAVVIGRVYRDAGDAADTSTDPAFLINVDMHYEKDRRGSVERNRTFGGY